MNRHLDRIRPRAPTAPHGELLPDAGDQPALDNNPDVQGPLPTEFNQQLLAQDDDALDIFECRITLDGTAQQHSYLFAGALFVLSILLFSQASTATALMPVGIARAPRASTRMF